MDQQQSISLRDLYPHLLDEQLEEAEANLVRFLAVMVRIAERLKNSAAGVVRPVIGPDLTASQRQVSIPGAKVKSTLRSHSTQP